MIQSCCCSGYFPCCFADLACAGASDPEDGGQANFRMLMRRNVDASDTCHFRPLKLLQSTLTLLVTRICADHTDNALAPNHFAVTANFFDRSRNFHFILLNFSNSPRPAGTSTLAIYLALNTMRARLRSYGVNSTVTLSPGKMRM